MKYIQFFFLVFFLLLINCKAQTPLQLQQTYQTEIIGIWESDDEPGYKLEFQSTGRLYTYKNNELIDTESYSVTISCNGQTISDGRIFLRIQDEDSYTYCQTLEAINSNNSNILSMTTEHGKLETYTKVN